MFCGRGRGSRLGFSSFRERPPERPCLACRHTYPARGPAQPLVTGESPVVAISGGLSLERFAVLDFSAGLTMSPSLGDY